LGGADGDGGDTFSIPSAMTGHAAAMVAMQLQKYAVDGHVACAAASAETIMPAAPKDFITAW
jgi:hypothetical protein